MFIHKPLILDAISDTTTSAGRTYHTPSGDLPSVTTVLSILSRDDIAAWRERVGFEKADEVLRRAGVRGTRFHNLCETYLKNEAISYSNPLEQEMFGTIRPILDSNITEIYGLELPLYSEYLGIAGRCDCFAMWQGRVAIIDFKTSLRTKTKDKILSYFLQATAYCIMIEERTGIPVDRFAIVIGVDCEDAQVFTGKRDDYIKPLINCIKEYYNEKDLPRNATIFSTGNN